MLDSSTYTRGTFSIGVPLGPKTRIYVSHKVPGSIKKQYRFLPVRDLINDVNDPEVVTISDNAIDKSRSFPVMAINEQAANLDKMWSYMVMSESGLSGVFGFAETSVVHGDALLTLSNGKKETVSRLMKHPSTMNGSFKSKELDGQLLPTKVLFLKTFSFTNGDIVDCEVQFVPWKAARSWIGIEAKKTDLVTSHNYVILNQGLLINTKY